MFNVFRQKHTPLELAQKMAAGTDPADLLKVCKGHYQPSDLERLYGELLTFQLFGVDFNLWVGIKDAALRDKVLDAYYPLVTAQAGLPADFYKTDAFVERMRAYGAASKSQDPQQALIATALGYFKLKPNAAADQDALKSALTLYLQLMSKTLQSALNKVLILEQQHAH